MTSRIRNQWQGFVLLAAAIVVIATPTFSRAQTVTDSAAGKKEKKTSLNFEDELVEGSASKPELFYLFQKKNFNYKRLIKLRENFLPEMRKTSEDLQRTRSAN